MDYVDPGCECDAPRFVDFDNLDSHLDDGADTWFDNHGDHDLQDSVAVKFEADDHDVQEDSVAVNPEPEVGTKNTARNLVGVFTSGISECNMRSPRVAAMKAAVSISEMTKANKKPVKSTEERQMEEIKRLQSEAKKRLRNSRRSYQKLSKSSKPVKVVRSSKPPTETKAFNFSKAAERMASADRGVGGSSEGIHPSNFASTLRTRHPSDQLDPHVSMKKPPTPESTTKPKPFKFELDRRPGLRSGGAGAESGVPMAEFVAKYQTATPPRFRSTPTNSKPPAATAVSSSVDHSLGSSITVPKTPNLLSRARARPVTQKSAAEQEEELVAKMKQYRFKAKPLNPNIVKLGGLLGVPRKRTNANLTQPVSPQLATKKLAMARKAQGGEAAEEMPDYDADRKFVAQPLPDFSEISGLPPKLKRPATVAVSPAIKKRRRLNETEEEEHKEVDSHLIKATAMPNFEKVFAPQYPQRMLIPEPFSFEERDKKKDSKETLVQRVLKDEQQSGSFKARPLPSTTFQPSQLPKASSSVTMPEPFTLHTELRGGEHALKWKEKVENQFDEETKKTNFKASVVPNVYGKPFAPKKSTKPLTSVGNMVLHSELRSSQRAKFDEEKLKRIHVIEEENLQRRALREAKEAKEIAALRKTLVHKAQPIGYQVHSSQ